MFVPNKWKFKKKQKGKKLNTINKIVTLHSSIFGKVGLKAIDSGHMTSKQIVSLRHTVSKLIKKKGKLKINIFPNMPITKKPLEVRMGKGKGNVDHWIFKVRSGAMLCEIETPHTLIGLQALKLVQIKVPIRTKIINKQI